VGSDKKKKKGGGEGVLHIHPQEVTDVTTLEKLAEDILMDMSASEPVPDNKEEDREAAVAESKLTLDNLADVFDYSSLLLTSFTTWTLL